MGLLHRLFGAPPKPCDMCQARPVSASVLLPNRLRMNVCDNCRAEADSIFEQPVYDFEFGRVVDALGVSGDRVLGVPWGSDRDQALEELSPQLRSGLVQSASPYLISLSAKVSEVELKVRFVFPDGALDEVSVSPHRAVRDAYSPLKERFGEPVVQHPMGREYRWVWKGQGFEVWLTETDLKTVNLAVRTPTLD